MKEECHAFLARKHYQLEDILMKLAKRENHSCDLSRLLNANSGGTSRRFLLTCVRVFCLQSWMHGQRKAPGDVHRSGASHQLCLEVSESLKGARLGPRIQVWCG